MTDRTAMYAAEQKPMRTQVGLTFVVLAPFAIVIALAVVAPYAAPTWDIAVQAVVLYVVSMAGVTIGFHRLFTHRSFKARRGLKIALAAAGSLALQGNLLDWVADHRRHHAQTETEDDPHSPWIYGTSPLAVARGMFHAHMGWLWDRKVSNPDRYAPDIQRDPDLMAISRSFGWFTVATLAGPPLITLTYSHSFEHVLASFLWAGVIRVFVSHHIAWSTNSICHVFGSRPFETVDRSGNVGVLAPLSLGESWHNNHHAMPTSARHGMMRGQLDASAFAIRLFERMKLATNVHWPTPAQIAAVQRRLRAEEQQGTGTPATAAVPPRRAPEFSPAG